MCTNDAGQQNQPNQNESFFSKTMKGMKWKTNRRTYCPVLMGDLIRLTENYRLRCFHLDPAVLPAVRACCCCARTCYRRWLKAARRRRPESQSRPKEKDLVRFAFWDLIVIVRLEAMTNMSLTIYYSSV